MRHRAVMAAEHDEADAIARASRPLDVLRVFRRTRKLWRELFRDLALIEVALAGGIITPMGTAFEATPGRTCTFAGVVARGLGAVCAFVAQTLVIDLSDTGRAADMKFKTLRRFR